MKKAWVVVLAAFLWMGCSESPDAENAMEPIVNKPVSAEDVTRAHDLLNEANVIAESLAGEPEDAVKLYSQALEINPELLEAYQQRGQWRMYLEEFGRAATDFEMAVKLDANNHENHYYLGLCKYNQDDIAGAVPHFDQTIALDSSYANAFYSRGLAKIKLGEKDEACKDLYTADGLGESGIYFLAVDSFCIKPRAEN